MLQPVVQRPGGVTGPLGPGASGTPPGISDSGVPYVWMPAGGGTPPSDPRGAPTAIAYAGWTFPAVFTTA
jgi:hypothetical protein